MKRRELRKGRSLAGCLMVAVLTLLLIGMAEATDFCVSTAVELRAALLEAQGNGQDDVIRIVQGTYNGNSMYTSTQANSLTIEGGYTDSCSGRMIDPSNTVLDTEGSGRVLELIAPSVAADFVVDALTLKNGYHLIWGGLGLHSETLGRVRLTNSIISDNTPDDSGYGVLIIGADEVDLVGNTITRNQKRGVLLDGVRIVRVQGNIVSNNIGRGMDGAGIGIYDAEIAIVTNNTFTGNQGDCGGGLATERAERIILTNNFFGFNYVSCGGGAYISGGQGHQRTTVTNNTFYLNRGTLSGGGGILIDGLPESSVVEIYNNVFWENDNQSGNDIAIYNWSTDQLYIFNNDFDQSSQGTYIQVPPASFDPSNLNKVDPLLVDAPNGDYHLTAGSPCEDAGTAGAPELPEFDFEGDPRIYGLAPDIGADEVIYEDTDGDGIPDDEDACPNSVLSSTVVIDGCDSGVENNLLEGGCTISDRIEECAADVRNHGKFVSCVSKLTNKLKKAGLITGSEKGAIQSCAAQSDYGKKKKKEKKKKKKNK